MSAARDRRIRELEAAAREHYAERWGESQRDFVDQPAHAVAEAGALVSESCASANPVAKDFESERPPSCRQPSRGRGALSRRARDLDRPATGPAAAEPAASATPRTRETADRAAAAVDEAAALLPDDGRSPSSSAAEAGAFAPPTLVVVDA